MHCILRTLLLAMVLLPARDTRAGAEWPPNGAPVCTDAANQLTPVAVSDGAGGAIVAWYDFRSGHMDIYAQRVLASGAPDPAWPIDGLPVCTAPGWQHLPVIVSDGAGGAIVAWQDERTSSANIYAQRVLASGSVDPAWPADGRALCTASGDQAYPVIAGDGAGGAYVAWRDYRGGPETNLYAQRVLGNGAIAAGWPANGLEICTASGNQSTPSIAGDGAGGAFIAWSDLRNDQHSDIYVQRVLAGGAVDPAWPADGHAVCTAAWNQSEATIIPDGQGAAIVAWSDYRSGAHADIYAHRVLASSAVDPAWPASGAALCTSTGEQYTPRLVSDDAGGAFAVWYDYRGGETADIYAHRVFGAGLADPAWPANGRAVCTASGDQVSPAVTPDGAGGALFAWMDYRSGGSGDLYTHRVHAGGALDATWPADGLALCTAAGEQFSPFPIGDGAGGVIVAWTDFRPGAYADIYAQRVTFGANVGVAPAAPGSGVRILAASPNPAAHGATVHVRVALDRGLPLQVDVLDPAGRRIATLNRGGTLEAGVHAFDWRGAGSPGVYWIRARAGGVTDVRSVVLRR